jgi:hypothetical protein
MMRALVILSVLCSVVCADELQLKDGKKLEFVAFRDLGDSIEVETKQGSKVTVKRSDVERVNLTATGEAPLTGATFTFDKKRKLETVDCFAKIEPKKGIGGDWKLSGGVLTGTAPTALINSRINLGIKPPEEYDLSFTLERTTGNDGFYIGLLGGGRSFIFQIDALNSNWTGPYLVDGKKDPATSGVGVSGTVLKNGVPRLITVMVRREALIVQVDRKDHFAWKAEWSRLSMDDHTGVTEQGTLFVGMRSGSTYQIRAMTMTTPKN